MLSDASTSLRISTARSGSRAVIRIAPVSISAKARATASAAVEIRGNRESISGDAVPLILASRLISAQVGEVTVDQEALTLRIGGASE